MKKLIFTAVFTGVFLAFLLCFPAQTQAGMEDDTPPEVTSFNVSPTEINTWDEDQTIIVTFTVVDSDSGCEVVDGDGVSTGAVGINFDSALSEQSMEMPYDSLVKISGDLYEGTYQMTGVIPKWSKSGIWGPWISVNDRVGNSMGLETADLNELLPDDDIVVANTTDSTSLTIDTEWVLSSNIIGNKYYGTPMVTVTFPEDTVITRSEGGIFQIYKMLNQTASVEELTLRNRKGTSLGTIKLGIPGLNLHFSKDVTISMYVGSEHEDRKLLIQSLIEGGDAWANEATCTVDEPGYCNFTVDHASYFSANSVPIESILTGAGPGGGPQVRTLNYKGIAGITAGFFAFDESFRGGTHVASGDIDGDGMDEIIVGMGPGEEPWVRVFEKDGTKITEFLAYGTNIQGGVYVTSGDLDGDGIDEIITGVPEGFGPHVRVFDGRDGSVTITAGFFAYDKWVRTGIRVASGDLDGDGIDEIVTGTGYGAGTHVRTFSGTGEAIFTPGFFVYGETDRTGIKVAVGDTNGNGKDEIITGSGPTREPEVRIYDRYGDFISSFTPFASTYRNGVKISAGDIDGDRKDEIVVGTEQGGGPQVRSFEADGRLMYSFFAYDENFRGGVDVAVGNYGLETLP